ncbi:hypothetical protein ACJX0J_008051, partial [Zea mays]
VSLRYSTNYNHIRLPIIKRMDKVLKLFNMINNNIRISILFLKFFWKNGEEATSGQFLPFITSNCTRGWLGVSEYVVVYIVFYYANQVALSEILIVWLYYFMQI